MCSEEFTDREIDILLKVYYYGKQKNEGEVNQSPYNRSIKIKINPIGPGLHKNMGEVLSALEKFERNGYIKVVGASNGYIKVANASIFINKKGLRFIKDHVKLKNELNL